MAPSLEELAAAELRELGAENDRAIPAGVHFQATPAVLYRINHEARLPAAILAPLASFPCRDADELYRQARTLDWPALFPAGRTLRIEATIQGGQLAHSHFAALKLKDAVVDCVRAALSRRPDVARQDPDVRLHLFIAGRQATVSFDTSGAPLHQRGYRARGVAAPLRETLAAAMVRLSGWDGRQPLVDPCCGSGTILAEAWMRQARIPANYLRERFGFECLPDFDAALWRRLRQQARAAIVLPPAGLLAGADNDPRALAAARMNLDRLPGGERITLRQQDFRAAPGYTNTCLITNLPYGLRLEGPAGAADTVRAFGDFLKQRCLDSSAYIYFGERELLKQLGLRPQARWPLRNGALDGRLVRVNIYPGRHLTS